MTESLEQVYEKALQLSVVERGRLAARLIESLPEDDEYRDAWKMELDRRMEELNTGQQTAVPVRERYP